MNVAESMERSAGHCPDAPALLFEGSVVSYRSLRDQVDRVAAGLRAAGVEPGDRVALFLPNIPAFAVAYQACQWMGAVSVSANVMLTTEEMRYLLEDSGARLVFTTEALWGVLEPLVEGVLGGRERVVVCEGTVPGTRSLESVGQGLPTDAPTHRESSDPAAILYTSGTTGRQRARR
jgi:long-chain acyl-CoA synthetase